MLKTKLWLLPLLWLVREGQAHGYRPYEKLLLVTLWLAPYATRAAALPLHINLMPLAAAVLVWLVWSRGAPSPAQATGIAFRADRS